MMGETPMPSHWVYTVGLLCRTIPLQGQSKALFSGYGCPGKDGYRHLLATPCV